MKILSNLKFDENGIYCQNFSNIDQKMKIKMRRSIAKVNYKDYLSIISKHHSIKVMDKEVGIFVRKIPKNGLILDVGGCWGWHWRKLFSYRPDIKVIILDFVKENLLHAKKILGNKINKNFFLVHGDGTNLNFEDNTFDGWWSVQTLQHIPNFEKATKEAWRVLKKGGHFANYSLNNQLMIKIIWFLFGKKYHTSGHVKNQFYLELASNHQFLLIEEIFKKMH